MLLIGFSAVVFTSKPNLICLGTLLYCVVLILEENFFQRKNQKQKLIIVGETFLSSGMVMVYIILSRNHLDSLQAIFGIVMVLIAIGLTIEKKLHKSPHYLLVCCVLILGTATAVTNRDGLTNDVLYQTETQKDRTELGGVLKQYSDVGDVYMADPYDGNLDMIRLLSRRAQYVSYKAIGYNDEVTIEWIDRMLDFGGITKTEDGKYEKNEEAYRNLSGEYLANYAKNNNIKWFIEPSNSVRFENVEGMQCFFENQRYKLYQVE